MQLVSWIILGILCLGSSLALSPFFGWSVLAGGLISIGSFWQSYREVVGMVDSITSQPDPGDRQYRAQEGKKGYLLRFWIRLAIIGVVLLVLIKYQLVNTFGLVLGLSTVVLGVTIVSMNVAGRYFFRGRR